MLIGPIDLIKNSLKLYLANWKKFVIYLALLLAPTLLLTMLGLVVGFAGNTTRIMTIVSAVLILAVLAATIIFSLWISIALMQTIKRICKNEPVEDWKKTISDNSKYLWPVILTSVITTVIVIAGSIFLIIPGVIFFIWYVFSFYAVIFDNKTSIEALHTSKGMVVGRWFKIFWRVAIPSLIYGLIASLIIAGISLPFNFIKSELLLGIIDNLLNTLINLVLTPLMSMIMIMLYYSAKENPVDTHLPKP